MSQRQQLERIMEIDRRIRNGKFPTAAQLSSDLEVSRRVIFNDRNFMIHRLGAPIAYDRVRGGWYYRDESWILPGIIMTEADLLAFFLSIEVSRRYLGTSMEQLLYSAVEKLSQSISGTISVKLDTLRSIYSFTGSTLLASNEKVLLDLHQAISTSTRVWMRYYTASRDEHTQRVVHPYHLSNIRGDWYLLAFDELRQEIRNFAIGRIEEWKLLDDKFKRDPHFSPADFLSSAFNAERGAETEDIVIRFAPEAARYVRERQWHETQQIEEEAGGGLLLKFRTSGLGEVKRWVLQYGANAEVLAPDALRKDCRDEVNKLHSLYAG